MYQVFVTTIYVLLTKFNEPISSVDRFEIYMTIKLRVATSHRFTVLEYYFSAYIAVRNFVFYRANSVARAASITQQVAPHACEVGYWVGVLSTTVTPFW